MKAGNAEDDERLTKKRKDCRPSKSAKAGEKEVKMDEPVQKVKDDELSELTA